MSTVFGEYLAELRRERKNMSLREFCRAYGFDPGNFSKRERGKLPPPQSRQKLAEYATALDLTEGSDEWTELFDRAAAARGEIPPELLEDEELVAELPVLFRTLRGERVSEENLNRLAKLLRTS